MGRERERQGRFWGLQEACRRQCSSPAHLLRVPSPPLAQPSWRAQPLPALSASPTASRTPPAAPWCSRALGRSPLVASCLQTRDQRPRGDTPTCTSLPHPCSCSCSLSCARQARLFARPSRARLSHACLSYALSLTPFFMPSCTLFALWQVPGHEGPDVLPGRPGEGEQPRDAANSLVPAGAEAGDQRMQPGACVSTCMHAVACRAC